MGDFDLGCMQVTNSGLDSFLADGLEPVVGAPLARMPARPQARAGKMKIASLSQLEGFIRTAEDTLVHKSDRDLWALRKDGSGEFYIERMFDSDGAPLKG